MKPRLFLQYLCIFLSAVLCGSAVFAAPATSATTMPSTQPLDPRFVRGEKIFSDDFQHGLDQWTSELERGGTVAIKDGHLDIEVPAGCTVWFKSQLDGPVLIEYDATVIKAGGPYDRVSDLNCFWMATDSRAADGNIFDVKRSGKFADYNQLKCYYVGLGGNTNTTTRFRRYIGSATNRPILPEHDLNDPKDLIKPNVKQTIQLIACGNLIQYYRDGTKVFEYDDPQPYTRGWFAIRTTWNHMSVENFRVYRLTPKAR